MNMSIATKYLALSGFLKFLANVVVIDYAKFGGEFKYKGFRSVGVCGDKLPHSSLAEKFLITILQALPRTMHIYCCALLRVAAELDLYK